MDMRTIQVSDATYAVIWARWKEGDAGEEGIIRRVFGVEDAPRRIEPCNKKIGYRDSRSGVEFPTGFKIFRVFKGKERWAVAENDGWMADNNRWASSLNKLSAHIGAPTENAWVGWYYMDGSEKRLIAELRDPSRITRRS